MLTGTGTVMTMRMTLAGCPDPVGHARDKHGTRNGSKLRSVIRGNDLAQENPDANSSSRQRLIECLSASSAFGGEISGCQFCCSPACTH